LARRSSSSAADARNAVAERWIAVYLTVLTLDMERGEGCDERELPGARNPAGRHRVVAIPDVTGHDPGIVGAPLMYLPTSWTGAPPGAGMRVIV